MKNNNFNDENIIEFMKLDNIETNPEKYKMQCMLPDYVFNKLREQEKTEFEKALSKYPDIQEEVNDAKALFYHIEKFDYKKMMYDKSQYLPDRVVARLKRRNAWHKEWKPKWRRVIAMAVGAAAILIYFHFNNEDVSQIADSLQFENETAFFADSEIEMIAGLQDIFLLNDDADLQEVYDNYISTINDAVIETIQSGSAISLNLDNDYMYFLEELENIDEEFLQAILNQLANF